MSEESKVLAPMDAKDQFVFMLLERLDQLTDDVHALSSRVSFQDELIAALSSASLSSSEVFLTVTRLQQPPADDSESFVLRLSEVLIGDSDSYDQVRIVPMPTSIFNCVVHMRTFGEWARSPIMLSWLTRITKRLGDELMCSVRIEARLGLDNLYCYGKRWAFRRELDGRISSLI